MTQEIEHKHHWEVKAFGWRTDKSVEKLEDVEDYLHYKTVSKPGSTIHAHNIYFCYGCRRAASGHRDTGLWYEDTGEKVNDTRS